MTKKINNIIKYQLISNKNSYFLNNRKYNFNVNSKINKKEIKNSIESLFNVQIKKINTIKFPKKIKNINKKLGSKAKYKKAIVTLAENQKISLFSNKSK